VRSPAGDRAVYGYTDFSHLLVTLEWRAYQSEFVSSLPWLPRKTSRIHIPRVISRHVRLRHLVQ
jgi:hypothetical protein